MKIENDRSSDKKNPTVIRVVLNVPTNDGLFDYEVPEELQQKALPGCLAAVPFQNELMQGIIWKVDVIPETASLRKIIQVIDEIPVLTKPQMMLAEILSERCLAPLFECVNLLLTEKIRKLSQTQFTLIKQNPQIPGAQPTFLSEAKKSTVRDQVLAAFPDLNEPITPLKLDQTVGKNRWRYAINNLISEGFVRKETVFHISDYKPKMVRAAKIISDPNGNEWIKLSNSPERNEKRKKVLRLLQEHSSAIPLQKLYEEAEAERSDLLYLEKKGLISLMEIEVWRDYESNLEENYPSEQISLNSEQIHALNIIEAGLQNTKEKKPILLHGVTGSGKTELYLQAAERTIAAGKQVLVLVPEISLTPQILNRFQKRFPERTGIYHSRLSTGERYDTWRRARNGQFQIVIGPRSVLSIPLQNIGLIIVDECHDDSYYQTEGLPYFSAVQAAADYAKLCHAQLILGSATPTTAQMYKAEQSNWKIVKLFNRATGVQQPIIRLVDMRQELKAGNQSVFSRQLSQELETTLSLKKQSILFLNRRGSASYVFCHFCGYEFRCPKCEIPMTSHAQNSQLVCHFCGYSQLQPERCPACGHAEIRHFGTGVEEIERILTVQYPDARLIRMDAETTTRKGQHEQMLTAFARHEADILIGTQMVAKGLDFPDVRLVGMILADVGTNFHDYRADEHAFQMLTQVAGRAGRAQEQGLAILQTFQPARYSIRAVVKGDFYDFYRHELKFRKEIGYPPFSRMIRLEIADPVLEKAESRAFQLASDLKKWIDSEEHHATRMIGPAPCFFPRINGKYRWHVILRGPDPLPIVQKINTEKIRVEVDPPSLL